MAGRHVVNDRERFLASVLRGTPDRIPLLPTLGAPRPVTLRRWQDEGLPRDVPFENFLYYVELLRRIV
jgi:hypothetical protein